MHHSFGYSEEDQLKQTGDLRLWRRIMRYVGPQWPEVAGAVFLSFIITGCSLALPHLVRLAVDNFIVDAALSRPERLSGISHLSGIFLGLVVTGFLANFLQVILLEWTGQRVMHRMRQDLFRHMLGLSSSFFNRQPLGRLVTRLTNDIQNMHEMFTSVIVTIFNDLVRIGAILLLLAAMNLKLALLLLLLLPLIILNTTLFSRLARRTFREIRTSLARVNSFLQENLGGINIIQSFSRERERLARFAVLNQDYTDKTLEQIRLFGLFMPILELLSSTGIALIIWYGGGQIIQDKMSLGALVAFLSYLRLFFQPLRELSQKYSIVQSALASAERIFQLLDTENSLTEPENPVTPDKFTGRIEFNGVSFSYKPKSPVLHNLDFTVEPGETVALIGATGSGKTSVINLLERFYDPDRGEILFDGLNLREYHTGFIRRQIGLVMQEVYLQPGSIRENICLDRPMPQEQLLPIIKAARLESLIASLPDGIETRVGDGGQELSAGQRQLLALARVLARDPRILILDEATSNIDTETEILIEKALAVTLANRTSLVIAHRLSTIRRADRILVMEGGRIIEEGNHEQLMGAEGRYFALKALDNEISTTVS